MLNNSKNDDDTASDEVSVCERRHYGRPLSRVFFAVVFFSKQISFICNIWYPVKHFTPGYYRL